MTGKDSFLSKRFKSVGFALKGLYLLIVSESSIKVQVVIAILVTVAGFYFNISSTEWILQCLAIGLVLSIEGLNTAIEQLCDFVYPSYDEKIGRIKDISAGAVTFAAITAVIIGCIIYFPKLF